MDTMGPDDEEFIPPDEPEMAESNLEEPLEGPSDDLLLPLLASFSDIFFFFLSLLNTSKGSA